MREGDVPKESETIKARRAARLAERLREARETIQSHKAWWSNGSMEFLGVSLLVILNVVTIFQFFGTSAVQTTYSGPVIPLLAKAVSLLGIPFNYATQIIYIIFFLIFPVTFYIFVKKISGRKLVALLSVLFASLPFYLFAYIRVNASFLGNDSAHIASLSIIPVALLGLISFVHNGGTRNLIVASVFSALVALISPFGFMTYAILAAILGFSEVLLGKGRQKLFRLLVVFLVAGGLSSFWYNPAFFVWMITGPMGEEIRYMISRLIPISFFVLPILGAFGYLLFDRKPTLQPVFLASFFSIAFAIIGLAGGGVFPSHPGRYLPEFGISLSFLLSILIVKASDYLKFSQNPKLVKYKKGYIVNTGLTVIFLLLISLTIFGKNSLASERQVLGIWEGVDKGDIWEAKDAFGAASQVLGYTISTAAIFGLGFLARKTSKTYG